VGMKAENLAGTDDLRGYTSRHRENYLLETAHLIKALPQGASVLQIGSMDGARAIGLLQARPDLAFTGLDIDGDCHLQCGCGQRSGHLRHG
jgi:hypothetical protein